ncbi:MAG: hypothetical protein AAF959_03645 [Cyanobacteria bacterium P01_D01_bin.56]
MAPKIPQLHTLPWHTFVGASIVLHIGIVSIGLPRVRQVAQPGNSTANIPITLVDGTVETVDAAASKTSPPTTTPSPSTQTVPQSTIPLGGQNITTEPIQQPSPQQATPAETPVGERNSTSEGTTPKPADNKPKPRGIETTDNQAPVNQPPSSPPTGDSNTRNEEASALVQIIIKNQKVIFYIEEEVAGEPKANFQLPTVFNIPANDCQRDVGLSPIVKVEIRDGSQVFPLTGVQNTASESAAICLLQVATSTAPTALSYDIQPNTPFDDVGGNLIPSIAVEFTLSFN